jgi:hypothetical protein
MRTTISAAALLLSFAAASASAQEPPRQPEQVINPLFHEPEVMAKGFKFGEKYFKDSTGERKAGWYPVFKTNVTGDGWISIGSGYRVPFADRRVWFGAGLVLTVAARPVYDSGGLQDWVLYLLESTGLQPLAMGQRSIVFLL